MHFSLHQLFVWFLFSLPLLKQCVHIAYLLFSYIVSSSHFVAHQPFSLPSVMCLERYYIFSGFLMPRICFNVKCEAEKKPSRKSERWMCECESGVKKEKRIKENIENFADKTQATSYLNRTCLDSRLCFQALAPKIKWKITNRLFFIMNMIWI